MTIDAFPRLIHLGGDSYAVRFGYHMVTGTTLALAVPSDFMRGAVRNRQRLRFAAESLSEAGTLRADSAGIARAFPSEVAALSKQVPELSRYVIFKLEASA